MEGIQLQSQVRNSDSISCISRKVASSLVADCKLDSARMYKYRLQKWGIHKGRGKQAIASVVVGAYD
jgi:hypothetical protein